MKIEELSFLIIKKNKNLDIYSLALLCFIIEKKVFDDLNIKLTNFTYSFSKHRNILNIKNILNISSLVYKNILIDEIDNNEELNYSILFNNSIENYEIELERNDDIMEIINFYIDNFKKEKIKYLLKETGRIYKPLNIDKINSHPELQNLDFIKNYKTFYNIFKL